MEHRGMIGATWETSRTQPHFRTTWLHSNKKHFSGSVISKNINSLRFFPLPQHYLVPVLSLCSAEEGGLGGEEGGIIVLFVQAAVAAAHAIATGHLRGLRRPPAPFQAPGSPRSRDPTRRWGTALNKWPELLESVEGTDGNPRAGESRYQSTSTYHCRGLRKRARRPRFLFLAGQQIKISLKMRISGLFCLVLEISKSTATQIDTRQSAEKRKEEEDVSLRLLMQCSCHTWTLLHKLWLMTEPPANL